MTKKLETIQKLNSLMVAVALLAPTITGVLANAFNITDGANVFVFIAVIVLAIIKFLYELAMHVHRRWGFTFEAFVLLASIAVLYLITNWFCGDEMNYNYIQLLFYAVMPIFVIGLDFKIEYVLRYSVYMSVATVLCLDQLLQMRWLGYGQADLGRVYSLITVLVCV